MGIALVVTTMCASFLSAQTLNRDGVVLIKDNLSRLLVRVLVAVPGDTVSVVDGRLIVNGSQSDRRVTGTSDWGPRRFGEFQYFVAGDPLVLNGDPAAWGIVSAESVLGTVQPRR